MTVFLIVLAVVLLLLVSVCFLPVTLSIAFRNGFFLKIRFSGIKLFEIEPEKDEEKNPKKNVVSDKGAENATVTAGKEIFAKLKKKYGLLGAIKKLLGFCGAVIAHIKKLLRHIKINKVRLNLTVATDNAAITAIEYGAVCSVVYPLLSFLDSCADVAFKQINVSSDFDSKESQLEFSLNVRLRVFYLLLAALGAFTEYKKFVEEENLYERK